MNHLLPQLCWLSPQLPCYNWLGTLYLSFVLKLQGFKMGLSQRQHKIFPVSYILIRTGQLRARRQRWLSDKEQHAVFPEDLSSVHSPHVNQLSITCNSSFRWIQCLWPLRAPALTYTYSHTFTELKIKINLDKNIEPDSRDISAIGHISDALCFPLQNCMSLEIKLKLKYTLIYDTMGMNFSF